MLDNQESPSKKPVKYSAIKCSKCENNVPSFWSDIIGYEIEMTDNKNYTPQLCSNCQLPLTSDDLALVTKYLKGKYE